MSEYIWTGGVGDDDFGDPNNWVNTNTGLPGEPGSSDVALVQTAGTIKGTDAVGALDLISSGGTLTAQALDVTAISMGLSGTVNLASDTAIIVTDDMAVVGGATVVQSAGSNLTVNGSDGTQGDVVTAMTFGQISSDNVAYTLTGLGTELEASDGNVMIGADGTATFTVAAGATLDADDANLDGSGNISLAGTAGARGTLVVTGTYTTLYTVGYLDVGEAGDGSFTLSGGADAEIGQIYDGEALIVGDGTGSRGTAVITGTGTRLSTNLDSIVVIGNGGAGALTISAGATADFGSFVVGGAATAFVVVEGAGSVLELHLQADIGSYANGSLQVLSGAHFVMAGNNLTDTLTLGYASGVAGMLTVFGAESTVNADNNQAQIGFYGTGSVVVSSAGAITTSAPSSSPTNTATFVGTEAGSAGMVTVENANSTWTAHGEFDVGYYGRAAVLVESGGAVSSGNYNGVAGFIAGNEAGSSGSMTVTGTGSKLTNSGRFVVGNYGAGMLTVSAAATVPTTVPVGSDQEGAIVGGYSGGTGSVTVTGTGATLSIGTGLVIGDAGSGTVSIGAGGTVRAASLLMAITGTGVLNMSGTNTALAVSGTAQFGDLARAVVAIGTGSVLSVGGAAELKDGHIALSGGSLLLSHLLIIDSGQLVSGFGTVQTNGIINTGTVQASGGTLKFAGGFVGTGLLQIASGATLSLGAAVGAGQDVQFTAASGNLTLGTAASFAATLSGFLKGDAIDLSSVVASSLSYSGQTLTVHESGGASVALKFAGAYSQTSFAMAGDGHGGTLITHT